MPAWLKITRPNVEIGGNFVIYQTIIIDLERATGFGMEDPTSVTFFVEGKAFVVNEQLDTKAFQSVMAYVQKITGQPLT